MTRSATASSVDSYSTSVVRSEANEGRRGSGRDAGWLALRLRAGEPAAVARLYERYASGIYALVSAQLGARARTEDILRVVHSVFERCCREIRPELCLPDQFAPWLMALTVRSVASALARSGITRRRAGA